MLLLCSYTGVKVPFLSLWQIIAQVQFEGHNTISTPIMTYDMQLHAIPRFFLLAAKQSINPYVNLRGAFNFLYLITFIRLDWTHFFLSAHSEPLQTV